MLGYVIMHTVCRMFLMLIFYFYFFVDAPWMDKSREDDIEGRDREITTKDACEFSVTWGYGACTGRTHSYRPWKVQCPASESGRETDPSRWYARTPPDGKGDVFPVASLRRPAASPYRCAVIGSARCTFRSVFTEASCIMCILCMRHCVESVRVRCENECVWCVVEFYGEQCWIYSYTYKLLYIYL